MSWDQLLLQARQYAEAVIENVGVARQLVKKGIMNKQKILINHWRWLQAQGPSYKRQAASCKLQAASLTRKNYNVIVSYKLKEKVCKQN